MVIRGNRLFAQCVTWCKTERLSLRFASILFTSCVLPNISWGSEFFISSPPALRVIDSALRCWGRFLLGWPSGSPVGAVLLELGWPDGSSSLHRPVAAFTIRTSTRHAFPWPLSLPALVFQESLMMPGSWPSLFCVEICTSSDFSLLGSFGIGSSFPSHVRPWFRSCVSPSPGPISS